MNNRNTGMIATIAAAVLCGCPGLFGLCWGLVSVFASFVPGADININGNTDPAAATTMGLVTLCISVIAIAIPVVVWFATRRRGSDRLADNEPFPPAS